jgi:peroxiredoxin
MHRLAALLLVAGTLAAADLPRTAGPLEFVSAQGAHLRLADQRGKVVLLEFLLTHCAACKAKARLLARLDQEYGPRGLRIFGLAIDEGAGPKLNTFAAETGARFPLGVFNGEIAKQYLQIPPVVNMVMPQVAIIDRKGTIRDQHGAVEPWMDEKVVEKNLRAVIEKLLAEPATRSGKK